MMTHIKSYIHSGALDEYINRESKHADKEVMKEVLLPTISVT